MIQDVAVTVPGDGSKALAWQTRRMLRIAKKVEAGDVSRVRQSDIDLIFQRARLLAARLAQNRRNEAAGRNRDSRRSTEPPRP